MFGAAWHKERALPPDDITDSHLYSALAAVAVFVALQLGAVVANFVLKALIRRAERRAPGGYASQVLSSVRGPAVLALVTLGFFAATFVVDQLDLPPFATLTGLTSWVGNFWLVVTILMVTYAVAKVVEVAIAWYGHNVMSRTETSLDDKLLGPLRRVIPWVIYVVGLLVALDSVGVSISPLLAGLGIAGLAVALAVQPTLNNFLSGTYIVAEGIFEEGDFIELESGISGFVIDVGWRSTKLRSFMNNFVVIPNAKLVDSIITNLNRPQPPVNVIVYCGVSYDTDLDMVERIATEASAQVIQESEHSVKSVEPFFGFDSFGDSNVVFWVFVQATDRVGSFVLQGEIVKGLHARFRREDIVINYPVRKLVYSPDSAGFPQGAAWAAQQAARAGEEAAQARSESEA